MIRLLGGQSIIVVGAGLAGLTAAVELHRLGASVTVLEAQSRIGGRVLTIREGFFHGQYAEAGADFIDEEQHEICGLVQRLGLKLIPVLRSGFSFVLSSEGKVRAPVSGDRIWKRLTQKLSPWRRAYRLSEQRWDGVIARKFGSMSVADWMRETSVDADVREMLVSMRGFFLADPTQLSLLSLLDQVEAGTPGNGRMYRIAGGNDRLPSALGKILGDKIYLRHEVLAVSQSNRTIRVRVRDRRNRESSLQADCVILAVPATGVRTLHLHPALPREQAAAFARLKYGPVTKTLLQFDRRFWKQRRRPLAYGTNLPIGAVWDANEQQGKRSGILCLMAGGSASAASQELQAAEGTTGMAQALEWLGKEGRVLSVHSVSWENDHWVQGGYAVFDKDYDPVLRSWLARPHGRIFFAGEHTSLRWQGYMNGAVESGLRAAAEIQTAT